MARGALPWTCSDSHKRVMMDANEAIVGIMDTADIAQRVVDTVNGTIAATNPYRKVLRMFVDWESGQSDMLFPAIIHEAKKLLGIQG
jgi:hypothetical protein